MTNQEKIIKNKVGILELAKMLGNVSQSCKVFGDSRDSFYRFKELYEKGGEEALMEISRKKPNLKNRVPKDVEDKVLEMALLFPAYGQVRTSNELRKKAISVSPSGIRNIWLRYDLANMKKRLKALEEKMKDESYILTEDQSMIMITYNKNLITMQVRQKIKCMMI